MSLKNAKSLPQVYYGLHFELGVAEYSEPGKEPSRVLINEKTAKEMDKSFPGRPVYVRHVRDVDLANIQEEADGYVVESFFNQLDGKHWAKFIIVSDKGHEAISKGWKLSNAYFPTSYGAGGQWHGVSYQKEVLKGEYNHLAIVPDPRYEASVIYTPEKFKEYNAGKDLELKMLSNSKTQGAKSMFNFFSKKKIENSADLETMSVTLPTSGKEVTITDLITNADKIENMAGFAAGEHRVKVGDDEMSVNELVEKHLALKDAMKKNEEKSQEKGDEEKKNEEKKSDDKKSEENKEPEAKKENDDSSDMIDDDKKKNEESEEEKKLAEIKKNAHEALKNAPLKASTENQVLELSSDRVARGVARYGSGR